MSRRFVGRKQIAPRVKPEKQLMTVEAAWQVTVTRRDGSVHRYTERRGRHSEIGEVIEIRDATGPPLIARIDAVHHDPQTLGALAKWNVAAIEIGQ
jgi:hypothetical protein